MVMFAEIPTTGLTGYVSGPSVGRITAYSGLGHPALKTYRGRRSGVRGRIVRRIARYIGLFASMYVGGYAAGMFLPLGWTGTVATGLAITGGARAAMLTSEDLSRIGWLKDHSFTRTILSGKVGGLFGLVPFVGAFHGTVRWTIREGRRLVRRGFGAGGESLPRRIIEAGRRGLTGWGN